MRKISKRFLALLLVIVTVSPIGLVPGDLFVPTAEAADVSGKFLWPVASCYNMSRAYTGYSAHSGIDIQKSGIKGSEIRAAYDGTIHHFVNKCPHESASCKKCDVNWMGVGVVIKHNIDGKTYYTSYAHMIKDSIPEKLMKRGAVVKQGEVIGKVGSSGNSTGPHLHFSIASNSSWWYGNVNNTPTDKRHNITSSKGISYIYKPLTQVVQSVSQPTVSTSNYVGGVKVTLKSSTSGAAIYYTTNGSTPTVSSKKYTGAFNLTSTATVKAVAVKSGMNNSSVMSKKVTVNKVSAPAIKNTLTASGFNITINAEKNATVYYTTNGSTPTASSTKYTGMFAVYENATVKAIAVANGKANSAVASATLSAKTPAVPSVKLDSSSKNVCGIGDSVTVSWGAVSNAYEYKAVLSKDGVEVDSYNTQSTLATFTPEAAGTYTITVKAVNFIGESAASSPVITVTVKPDVVVTFKDYNDKVIEIKRTKYGSSVTAPAPTQRTGYDFSMWNGKYTNVTADTTVTAVYTPKQFTVTFVDENDKELKKGTVSYGEPFKNVPEAPIKPGYKFAAWSVKTGEGNSYTKVNGAVTFEPTYVWANPDLPLAVTASKAVRSPDLKSYDVTVNIINGTDKAVNGKMVAVVKTANDKVVATAIQAVAVPAKATNYTQTVKISGTEDGMLAEVYVLANDTEHSERTGGAYSEKASVKVTKEVSTTEKYWGDWSKYSTTHVTATNTREVETKTQYRYRNKETTTSTNSSLSGWTQSGSSVSYGNWGSWSSWSETKQTETDVKDVETRKVYKYYHYCNGSNGIAPSKKYSFGKYGPHYYYSTTKKITGNCETTGLPLAWGLGKCSKGVNGYYYDSQVTQYRYRTRSKTTTYSFWKWGSYSEWSDSVVTATDTRQVETRTVYRYRDLKEKASTGTSDYIATENLSGTKYSFNGNLTNVSADYAGKTATVMVYRKQNVDSLEFQLEYIGQIKLGSGNSYSFSFIPRQEISAETGDYIVSFGVATANGLINNVEIVEAPKPTYKVDFYNYDGTLLKSENVEKGGSATAPALAEIDGYELRWNRTFTNVHSETSVKAEKVKKSYNLIFVDWENSEIVDIREAEFGSSVTFPSGRQATGKKFVGWSVPAGTTVTGDMIIEAVYDDITFTVEFLNKDGSVFDTQTVSYGNAAVLPIENPTAEGYEFISWDNNGSWWNVTSDITVKPVFIFNSTVEAPIFSLTEETTVGFAQVEVETSTEGAEIRYTTDGSEPTEESPLFDGVIFVEETTTFKAKAFKEEMLSSQAVECTFEVIPSEIIEKTNVSVITDGKNHVTGNDFAKLCMRIDNPYGYEISSWGYALTDTETNETAVHENTAIAGTKDVVIGRIFNVEGLRAGATYSYYFFVEFKELGTFESVRDEFKTGSVLSIRTPSTAVISYGDTITLHADVTGALPEGAKIKWEASNGNFAIEISDDGKTCRISPKSNGDTKFTASVIDENNNVISSDEQLMTSKAGIFDKIVAFFKKLFNITETFPQIHKNK